MKNENSFLLCLRYDARVALKNRIFGALEEHTSECSQCRAKVLISKASLDLLTADKTIKPICQDCAEKFNRQNGSPAFAMTVAQLKEVESVLQKMKAAKN